MMGCPRAFGPEKGLESFSEHLSTDAARATPPLAVVRLRASANTAAAPHRKRSLPEFIVG